MIWSPHVQQVVSSYSNYLLRHHGSVHKKKFDDLYNNDEEAGVAEAIVFSWLYSIDLNPKRKEDISKGGPDFICQPQGRPEFVVEATSLGIESLSNKTNWPNDLEDGGGPFSLPISLLQRRVKEKVRQLSNDAMPRILAIVSSHNGAGAFFSGESAIHLLVGGYEIGFIIGDPSVLPFKRAKLENSVFIQRDKNDPDKIVPCRQGVSAIILIALDGHGFSTIGVLHPEPYFPLDPQTFPPRVPFCGIQPWPTVDGAIHIKWTTADTHPLSTRFDLTPIPMAETKQALARTGFSYRTTLKLLIIALALLLALFSFPAAWIERFYTNGFYSRLQSLITPVTNLLPFALGDLLIIALIISIPAWWIVRIKRAKGKRWRETGRLAFNTLTLAAIIFLGFLFLWGFNYQRQPLAAKLDYDNARLTDTALKQFKRLTVERVDAEYLQARAGDWPDETAWRDELHQSFGETLALLGNTRNIAGAKPKTSIFDFYLGSAGIAGFVNPFGLEVVLDAETLFFEKPFTLAHEWAHLAGYANEAEASFVGALACIRSDSAALRYSGWLALYQHAPWPAVDENDKPPRPSEGVVADIRAISERVSRRLNSTISEAQWKMYDSFLKANRVREGTRSYGLLVDLLVGTRFEDGWIPAPRK